MGRPMGSKNKRAQQAITTDQCTVEEQLAAEAAQLGVRTLKFLGKHLAFSRTAAGVISGESEPFTVVVRLAKISEPPGTIIAMAFFQGNNARATFRATDKTQQGALDSLGMLIEDLRTVPL